MSDETTTTEEWRRERWSAQATTEGQLPPEYDSTRHASRVGTALQVHMIAHARRTPVTVSIR